MFNRVSGYRDVEMSGCQDFEMLGFRYFETLRTINRCFKLLSILLRVFKKMYHETLGLRASSFVYRAKHIIFNTTLLFFIFGLFSFSSNLYAQNFIVIDTIVFEGNKRTKPVYILREIGIQQGDSIQLNELEKQLNKSTNLLYSTDIFSTVNIDTTDCKENHCTLLTKITENLSIYPFPVVDLIDNINVWRQVYDYDLNRVIYGVFIQKNNVRGLNEQLIFEGWLGFNRQLGFRYNFPYIDKKQTTGLYIRARFMANKEIAYNTIANKFAFYQHTEHSNQSFKFDFTLKRRKALKETHFIKLIGETAQVADSLIQLNPTYFNSKIDIENSLPVSNQQRYLSLGYFYEYNTRDITKYPLSGFYARLGATQTGLGLNTSTNFTTLSANASYYQPLGKTTFAALNIQTGKTFGEKITYYNSPRLGQEGNNLRGYELFVIEQQQYILFRSNLRQRLWAWQVPDPFGLKEKRKMSFKGYARLSFETAYADDQFFTANNFLANRWLYGTGIAIDFIFWETFPVSLEYSINHLNEKSIYIHLGMEWDLWSEF